MWISCIASKQAIFKLCFLLGNLIIFYLHHEFKMILDLEVRKFGNLAMMSLSMMQILTSWTYLPQSLTRLGYGSLLVQKNSVAYLFMHVLLMYPFSLCSLATTAVNVPSSWRFSSNIQRHALACVWKKMICSNFARNLIMFAISWERHPHQAFNEQQL